jgi:hypothetical protein
MSKFKVGDRVKCTCGGGADCTVQGRVVGIDDDGSARVLCDNGEEVTWQTKHLALIAAATPVAVAPTLELWRVVPGPDGKYATPGVTQAEWSEAIARINAQHKALDTVRRFLGSHSFASCSLACNRELREVMAVVLATLDSDKAFK